MELSIVLPAYREAENLEEVLPAVHAVAKSLTDRYEIVVVDSESPLDDTRGACQRHHARWVQRRGGSLYGHAIRTGIAEATGEHVLIMDADGSHDTGCIARLWAERHRAEIVIASRYVPGGKTENPAVLVAMSHAVNIVFRVVLQLSVHDVSNSFRLYSGAHLRALELECPNFDIVEEILVKLVAGNPGLRVLEIPTTFGRRKAGETKRNLYSFALSYVATLRRLRRYRAQAVAKREGR